MHGQVSGPMWTRLAQTAWNNTNTIVLQEAVQWKPGDVIIIATTDYHYMYSYSTKVPIPSSISWLKGRGNFPEQTEERRVKSVSGKTVVLDAPLNYTHWGEGFERAEVGLLTRNIVIRSDTVGAADQFGGHIMIRGAQVATIAGVEIYHMAQAGILGRYPLHFHLMGERSGDGVYVRDSSVHDCFQRGIVIHDSNGILVQNNIAYNNFGHVYFIEDGGERANIFDHNLGVRTQAVASESGRLIIPTDVNPSIFWITNPNNTYTNNAAVGGKFGYWFIMPVNPIGISAPHYSTLDPEVRPRVTPLGVFENNVAHSAFQNGLHIDDMLLPDGTTDLASYSPKQPPYLDAKGNNIESSAARVDAVFKNFISYKNRRYGSWSRGGPLVFTNFVLLDNLHGYNAVPGPSYLMDSLIVAETENKGLPVLSGDGERSRPGSSNANQPLKGVETYDNGGPQYIRNVTFVGFNINSVRRAGALGSLSAGPFALHARNKYTDLKFIDSNEVNLINAKADGPYNINIQDIDGSIVGTVDGVKGGWIVSNNSFLLHNKCVPVYDWNAYKCPFFEQNYIQITIVNKLVTNTSLIGANGTDFTKQFSDTNQPKGYFYTLSDPSLKYDSYARYLRDGSLQYMTNLKTRMAYTLHFMYDTPTPAELTLRIDSSNHGDWIVMALPYPSSALPFTITYTRNGAVSNVTQVSQLSDLTFANYYYDILSSHLYVKLLNINAGTSSYSQRWGYSDSRADGSTIIIKTSCPVSGCAVKKTSIPSNIPDTTDNLFRADLQACQQIGKPKSQGTGVSYFYFDIKSKELLLNVYHDLSSTVTDVTLGQGAPGIVGRVLQFPKSNYSPMRTGVYLSHGEWTSLIKGELYISIATTNYPNGEIRGRILCYKQPCTVPDQIPNLSTACSTYNVNNSMVIFEDGPLEGYPGWNSYVYTPTGAVSPKANFTQNEEVLCGTSSMKMEIQTGNIAISYPGSGTKKPQKYVDLSVYDTLEFYAKAGDDGEVQLDIQFQNLNNSVFTGTFKILSKHISNFKIDSTAWSRVRVPLTELKFTQVQGVKTMYFWLRNNTKRRIIYIDNIRFMKPTANDPLTTRISSNIVVNYSSDMCKNDPDEVAMSNADALSGKYGSLIAIVACIFIMLFV
jgi:cell migration-inducing and hyaluronan-binding protein